MGTSAVDELVAGAGASAAGFAGAGVPKRPERRVAIVTCMDARVNPYRIFGLAEGDAHVIRNAGGAVTEDVIRSLAISQRELGTEEIVLVHHSDCGMLGLDDAVFARAIQAETGIRPPWSVEGFADLDEDVRQSIARVEASPFLPHKVVRGFVFDVATGALREVGPA